MQGWKTQDWKYGHHVTGGGKCGTGIIGTKLQGWKMRDQAVMESQTPTCYGTHNMIYLIFRPPGTVVPGGLMFCCVFLFFFVALCGAIFPRWQGRSPWNFHTWLEVWALRLWRMNISQAEKQLINYDPYHVRRSFVHEQKSYRRACWPTQSQIIRMTIFRPIGGTAPSNFHMCDRMAKAC